MKKKDNRTWYQKVSRGGKRFIDLSNPYNLKHLTNKEMKYLLFQEETHRYNFTENTKAYRSKGITEFEKIGLRNAQRMMLSGKFYREALNNYGDAYKAGLEFNVYGDLAKLFEKVYDKLSYATKELISIEDLPNLPIFYKIRGKSDSKRNDIEPTSAEYAIKKTARILIEYGINRLDLSEIINNKQALQLGLGLNIEELNSEAKEKGKSIKEIIKSKL